MNVRALISDFRVYLQPQPVRMFLLGFSSGLPLLLILGTLSFWLREAGVDLKTIGFFSWIGLVYGFKWVWAPAVDRLRIPVLGRLLGRRRSWLLLSQAGVIAALAGMAVSDPLHHLQGIMVFALMCAFFSATQDIALDAYRIESADSNLQAVLAAMYQTGYRLAMIWAGAGTLALAAWSAGGETGYFPHAWEFAYLGMAASMCVGVLTVLFVKEPEAPVRPVEAVSRSWPERFAINVVAPFRDFFVRFGWGAAGILLLAGVITLLLPSNKAVENVPVGTEQTAQAGRLVAPVPYAESDGSGNGGPSIDWGTIGPVQQAETYTYTAAPQAPDMVPEFGRVSTDWFSDAAFLGDSLTAGIAYYDINVGGALVLGYEGTSPNQIVNRTALKNTNEDDAEQVPLDILAEQQPAKLYLLIGTNALAGLGNDEGFLAYYGKLLDELQSTLPNSMIFVQSILNVRPEALDQAPGLTPERVGSMNDKIKEMCKERGFYYLNLTEAFTGEDGYLTADYAQNDGIHLTVAGYSHWMDYLCTHVPYNKNNPYQQGSTYYLSDELRQLIADLP